MNDNHRPQAAGHFEDGRAALLDATRLAEMGDIASRAIVRPESLTMGEIREIGWGFLVAARNRPRRGPLPARKRAKDGLAPT